MPPVNNFLRKVQVAAKKHPELVGAGCGALVLGTAVPILGHVAGAVVGAAIGAEIGRRLGPTLE